MVWDIIRFNKQSLETLRSFARSKQRVEDEAVSIGDWLDERGYGEGFRRNYLIPMTASIWSTPPSLAFDSFPAITLLRFMHNHHLLQILGRPQWLTLKGGSQTYVKKVLKTVPMERLHHDSRGGGRVVEIETVQGGPRWRVISAAGHEGTYDRVIFATHADTALELLDDFLGAGDLRRDALSHFRFSQNEAVLHCDSRVSPLKLCFYSWVGIFSTELLTKAGSARQSTEADAPSQEGMVSVELHCCGAKATRAQTSQHS